MVIQEELILNQEARDQHTLGYAPVVNLAMEGKAALAMAPVVDCLLMPPTALIQEKPASLNTECRTSLPRAAMVMA